MLILLKRYLMAISILFMVIFLMVVGTYGVKKFGDQMFESSNIKLLPRGERVGL